MIGLGTERYEKNLKIAIDIGDRHGEGLTYRNLVNAFHSMCDFWKAMDHEKHMNIAIKIGDRHVEGGAYGNLGNDNSNSMGDFQKAVEYQGKHLNIAKEISLIGPEKEEPMIISVMLTNHWVTLEKPLNVTKKL